MSRSKKTDWMALNPKVSIITVVKDDSRGLTRTLKSILNQDFNDYECLIVIGGSDLETYEVAKIFTLKDPRIRWMKELSTGIYGAMNDGIRSTSGIFMNFMNAGDSFADKDSLGALVRELDRGRATLVIGRFQIDGNSRFDHRGPIGEFNSFDFAFNRNWGNHQAMLLKRSDSPILYDVKYKIAADFKFVLQNLVKGVGFRSDCIVASISSGGVSDINLVAGYLEKFKIRKEIFGSWKIRLVNYFWTIAAILKRIIKNTMNILLPKSL